MSPLTPISTRLGCPSLPRLATNGRSTSHTWTAVVTLAAFCSLGGCTSNGFAVREVAILADCDAVKMGIEEDGAWRFAFDTRKLIADDDRAIGLSFDSDSRLIIQTAQGSVLVCDARTGVVLAQARMPDVAAAVWSTNNRRIAIVERRHLETSLVVHIANPDLSINSSFSVPVTGRARRWNTALRASWSGDDTQLAISCDSREGPDARWFTVVSASGEQIVTGTHTGVFFISADVLIANNEGECGDIRVYQLKDGHLFEKRRLMIPSQYVVGGSARSGTAACMRYIPSLFHPMVPKIELRVEGPPLDGSHIEIFGVNYPAVVGM